MPVTSSSVPPKGRRISICSSDSGKTTHSRPRAFTSDPTAKLILASLICSNTATPHPEGDRMLPDRQGDRHTPPRGRPYPPRQARRPSPHPQGDRKGPIPTSTRPPPLPRLRRADELHRIFVRAGVVWSRVGTLAVALGVGWPAPRPLTLVAPSDSHALWLPHPDHLLPPKNIRILGNFARPILLVSETNHNVTPILQAHCKRGITFASFGILMIVPIDINRDHGVFIVKIWPGSTGLNQALRVCRQMKLLFLQVAQPLAFQFRI